MTERNTHKTWLLSCPTSDGNFKSHLQQASSKDIADVINELPEIGNKTKIKVLQAELRKRERK